MLPHIPHIHHMPNSIIRRNPKITRTTQNRLRINILVIPIQRKSMQHIRRGKIHLSLRSPAAILNCHLVNLHRIGRIRLLGYR